MEKNYDFIARHWCWHTPDRRDPERTALSGEVELDSSWCLGCPADAPQILKRALVDFQEYLLVSMNLSLTISHEKKEKQLWMQIDPAIDRGFVLEVCSGGIRLDVKESDSWRAVVYLEDCMNLELAPVLAAGRSCRRQLYDYRSVHSGSGIDNFSDQELIALVHAGYDAISIFLKDIDVTAAGPCNVNLLIERAESFGVKTFIFNYVSAFVHPDDPRAEAMYDAAYGEIFRHYPKAAGLFLCGESLEFPSKDPHTTGKRFTQSMTDGIPETKPSPGWYPCYDYPDYLEAIARAVHNVAPHAEVVFESYNWGWAPAPERKAFVDAMQGRGLTLAACYEIFAQKKLENLHTPVMDYTISTLEPSYYFATECEFIHGAGLPLQANCNTAGIGWDFGTVPVVPTPQRWLYRDKVLREYHYKYGLSSQYATHHYGWWASVAADLGKWSGWDDFEPDYDELLRKIAIRDYGKKAAPAVLEAWAIWSKAMDHYTASNEDQYGPWRVGPAYPFIFQPDITRTLRSKEIQFPTAKNAHFGHCIIRTLYHPFENENQSPGFLRVPAEIRSLNRMLELWNRGLEQVQKSCSDTENGRRLIALGEFIRNSVITTINIKKWWQRNVAIQTCRTADEALVLLDELEEIARAEIENARNTIPAVETDSRLGWEPSMEYVCDRWHLEWKIRQVESALREIATFRKMLKLHQA